MKVMDKVGVWLGLLVVVVGIVGENIPYALMGLAYSLKCADSTPTERPEP